MGQVRFKRSITNISTGTQADYPFSSRGGILLKLDIECIPRTYVTTGVGEEIIQQGDIHVYVGDAATAQLILGQDSSSPIIVPVQGDWRWEHPYRDEILAASSVIEKLAFYPFIVMPIGIIRGALRIIAGWDPVRQVSHDISVDAELLMFDANLT